MGKSALSRRFMDELPRNALVLAGRCYERESVPYKAPPPEAPPVMLLGCYRTEEAESSEFLPTFRQRLLKRVGPPPHAPSPVGVSSGSRPKTWATSMGSWSKGGTRAARSGPVV